MGHRKAEAEPDICSLHASAARTTGNVCVKELGVAKYKPDPDTSSCIYQQPTLTLMPGRDSLLPSLGQLAIADRQWQTT